MFREKSIFEQQQKLLSGRQMFDVELTTACNKHCYICPRDKLIRKSGIMTRESFDVLCSWLPKECDVFFAGLGEPLLHPCCEDFVRCLNQSGRGTSIMTNGLLLTEEKIGKLFEAGLEKLQISIIQKTDLNKIYRFIRIIPEKYKSRIVFNIIKEPAEMPPLETLTAFQKSGWRFCIKNIHNRGGLLFDAEYRGNYVTCATFFCDTFINADGNIHACSNDVNGVYTIGSIQNMSFEKLLEYKKRFLGNCQVCPICAHCTDEYRIKHFEEIV